MNNIALMIYAACLINLSINAQISNPVTNEQYRAINTRDNEGLTPLMKAVRAKNINLVKSLINAGANVNMEDMGVYPGGQTALMMAAENNALDIMQELIIHGAHVNAVAWCEQPFTGKPVLRYAIDSGSINGVKLLIKAGANVNAFTQNDIIHRTINIRNMPLLSFAIHANAPIEIIQLLIYADTYVNKICLPHYWTPLMVAAYMGNYLAVKMLLEKGADKNLHNTSDDHKTALDYAREKNHINIVKLIENFN